VKNVIKTDFFVFFVHEVKGEMSMEEKVFQQIFAADFTEVEKVFNGDFLKQIPKAKILEILALYRENLGVYESVKKQDDGFELSFDGGTAPTKIKFDEQGLINSIWFGGWKISGDSIEKIAAEFGKLRGNVSFCLLKNGGELVAGVEPELVLAVGSSFKMYILKALYKQIAEGKISLTDVVELKEEYKSLPGGILQNWPAGSKLTVDTLAKLMISISDNTATDHLLFLVGRENVEANSPKRNRPFLSTAEMFKLKWGVAKEVREKYLSGSEKEKRKILAEQVRNFPLQKVEFENIPNYLEQIEWLFSTRELCQILEETKISDAMSINPGLVDGKKWHKFWYKGGSEPGVLNYSIMLQAKENGDYYALSATINDSKEGVDEKNFNSLVLRLIGLLQ
jgi:beta-lactamase class A